MKKSRKRLRKGRFLRKEVHDGGLRGLGFERDTNLKREVGIMSKNNFTTVLERAQAPAFKARGFEEEKERRVVLSSLERVYEALTIAAQALGLASFLLKNLHETNFSWIKLSESFLSHLETTISQSKVNLLDSYKGLLETIWREEAWLE